MIHLQIQVADSVVAWFLGALRAWRLVRQVLEENETLRIGLCGGVDERGWYSEVAHLIWPEDQPWFWAAVVWVENT